MLLNGGFEIFKGTRIAEANETSPSGGLPVYKYDNGKGKLTKLILAPDNAPIVNIDSVADRLTDLMSPEELDGQQPQVPNPNTPMGEQAENMAGLENSN
jgi:hypothetical protein